MHNDLDNILGMKVTKIGTGYKYYIGGSSSSIRYGSAYSSIDYGKLRPFKNGESSSSSQGEESRTFFQKLGFEI